MNSYKVYLLGAGASYGYDENLPKNQWPPLTDDLFIDGARLGILTADRYQNLTQELIDYLGTQGKQANLTEPDSLKVNVEAFLSWLAKEFSEQSASVREVTKFGNNFFMYQQVMQSALGESRFFIYELLSSYSLLYQRNSNCYQKLSLSIKGDERHYAIVTLNYDTLLETALGKEGVSFHYLPGASRETSSLALAKLHGSINWANPRGRTIAYGEIDREKLFSNIVQHIHSNTAMVGQIQIVEVGTRDNLLRSGTDYYEPVVVPPFGLYKDYEHFPFLESVWRFGANLINSASEVVIVGCGLRKEDKQLCQMLQSVMTNNVRVTLVSPSHAEIEQLLRELKISSRIVNRYSSFVEYVQTL